MGLFNVIKGAYPSLQQIDKTLPVNSDATGIVRGSCIYEDAGEWKLATAAQKGSSDGTNVVAGAYIHYALMGQSDLTAGMAGTIGAGISDGVASVTGLACSMPMECETDQFEGTPALGAFLTLADAGKLGAATTANGETVYGQVTKTSTTRWDNAAVAVAGFRTGNKVNVIRFRTMYIPGFHTA